VRAYLWCEVPMGSFKWKEEYELGIQEIDNQHRELFKRVDKLTLSLYGGKGKSELGNLISFLKSYVEEHFSYEETIFTPTPYSDSQAHIKKHREFIDYFKQLDREIKSRGLDNYLAIKVEKDIRDWWEDHELNFDKKYVPYIKVVKL
jgi:hemerythrin